MTQTFLSAESITESNRYLEDKKKHNDLKIQCVKDAREIIFKLYVDKKNLEIPHYLSHIVEQVYTIKTVRYDKEPLMYIYIDGIYVPHARTYISELVEEILGKSYRKSLLSQIIAFIEARTYVDTEEFFKEENPKYIPLINGILNLETMDLEKFSPSKTFFSKINVIYKRGSSCQEFLKFLDEILPCQMDITRMQELFGLCIYRDYFLEKASIWTGTGRNGKGLLSMILKDLLGTQNTSSKPLEMLDDQKDKFATAELHGKLANISGEIGRGNIKNSATFKRLTGKDKISAQRKGQHPFEFVSYSTLIFLCNEVPISSDTTDAFFSRWIVFDFPYQFLPQKDIDERVKAGEDGSMFKLANPERLNKIYLLDGFPGIFNWAVEGLIRVLKNKKISNSLTVDGTREWYQKKSNPFLTFLEQNVVQGDVDNCFIVKSDLKKEFNSWRKENGIAKSIPDKEIKETLDSVFNFDLKRKTVANKKQIRVYLGLCFKNSLCQKSQGSQESQGISTPSKVVVSHREWKMGGKVDFPGIEASIPRIWKENFDKLKVSLEVLGEIEKNIVDQEFPMDFISYILSQGLLFENGKGFYSLVK